MRAHRLRNFLFHPDPTGRRIARLAVLVKDRVQKCVLRTRMSEFGENEGGSRSECFGADFLARQDSESHLVSGETEAHMARCNGDIHSLCELTKKQHDNPLFNVLSSYLRKRSSLSRHGTPFSGTKNPTESSTLITQVVPRLNREALSDKSEGLPRSLTPDSSSLGPLLCDS